MTIQRKASKKAIKKKVSVRKPNPNEFIDFQIAVNKKVVLTLKHDDSEITVFGILKEYVNPRYRSNYDFEIIVNGEGGRILISSEKMRINKTNISSAVDRFPPKYHISNNNNPSLFDY